MNIDDIKRMRELAGKATPIATELYGDRYMQGAWSCVDLTREQDDLIFAANPSTITVLCNLAERALAQDAQPSETVDTPEFRDVIELMLNEYWETERHREALIAHINAWQRSVAAKAATEAVDKACRDKDGNHVDDLRAWLDESREEFERQDVAFHACALKLKQYETAAQPVALDDDRGAFEAWATSRHLSVTRLGDGYESAHTDCAWNGWQARAMLSASSAALEVPPIEAIKDWSNSRLYDLCCRQKHEICEADKCIERYENENRALRERFASSAAGQVRPLTYKNQPDNGGAWRLGEACDKAAKASAGDWIDRGLGLLKELQEKGYGVVAIEPALTQPNKE